MCVYVQCPYRYSSQKNKTFKVLLLTHCKEPITVNSEYPDQILYCSVSHLDLYCVSMAHKKGHHANMD